MNAQVKPFPDPIETALIESAAEIERRRQVWHFIKDFYRPVIDAVLALGIEPRLSGEVDLSFAGDRHKLSAVVRVLRTHGFTTRQEPPKANDTQWTAYYGHPDCETRVWLYFTSSVCRRVKVGTKMVQEDIYEVQCVELPVDDALPTPTEVLEADEVPW